MKLMDKEKEQSTQRVNLIAINDDANVDDVIFVIIINPL